MRSSAWPGAASMSSPSPKTLATSPVSAARKTEAERRALTVTSPAAMASSEIDTSSSVSVPEIEEDRLLGNHGSSGDNDDPTRTESIIMLRSNLRNTWPRSWRNSIWKGLTTLRILFVLGN